MSIAYRTPSRLGVELTFCPRRPRSKWQEYRSKAEAVKVAAAFNRRLARDKRVRQYAFSEEVAPTEVFRAKADPFRVQWLEQPHSAWCIEVNNPVAIHPTGLLPMSDEMAQVLRTGTTPEMDAVQAVYDVAASLDLHPFISQHNPRTGVTKEWPTGGGHLHLSTDMWEPDGAYHLRMHSFERGLCLDYTNCPFIRWLWAQWMDDTNSELPLKAGQIDEMNALRANPSVDEASLTATVHHYTLQCHSIKQRMAATGKRVYASYEHRYLDMPRSMPELCLQVQFLLQWYAYWGRMVDEVYDIETIDETCLKAAKAFDEATRFTLTTQYVRRLREDLPFARVEVEQWFQKRLSLDYNALYGGVRYGEMTWDRAYVARALYGRCA